MTNQHSSKMYSVIKTQWVENARFIVDYDKRYVAVNEALYKLLGNPESIGIFYNDNDIFIMPNGLMPLTQMIFTRNKYTIHNSQKLVDNIELLFGHDDDHNTERYKIYRLVSPYYLKVNIVEQGITMLTRMQQK